MEGTCHYVTSKLEAGGVEQVEQMNGNTWERLEVCSRVLQASIMIDTFLRQAMRQSVMLVSMCNSDYYPQVKAESFRCFS